MTAMNGEDLLRKAPAWQTADGKVRHWEHVPSTHSASVAWAARLDDEPHEDGRAGGLPEGWPPEIEVSLRVRQERRRELKRVELISAIGAWPPFSDVVFRGATWWSRAGAEVETNGGKPGQQTPASNFDVLLSPGRVLDYFQLTARGDEVVTLGRRALRERATERPGLDTIGLLDAHSVFGMRPGGDEFVLDIDVATGILLRVVKRVHGREAEVMEWTSLTLDRPLTLDSFKPPSPSPVL